MRWILLAFLLVPMQSALADDGGRGPGSGTLVGGFGGVYIFDKAADLTAEEGVSAPEAAPLFGVRASVSPAFLLVDLDLDLGLLLGSFEDGSSFQSLLTRLAARYDFLDGSFRPFMTIGPALQIALTDDFGTDADVAFSAGAGASYSITDGLDARLDLTWVMGDGVRSIANDFGLLLAVAARL